MAKPEIKRITDLRGKKIGITRIGSSTHTSALFALNTAGLKQNDYQILPLVEVPNILTALIAGQVDAGVVSPPTNSRARKAGLNELMNLAKEGPEFVSVAVGTSRSYIKANEDTVRRVVRSYAEGVQIFKTNKAAAQRMMQKYLRVKEQDILDDAYNQFREYLGIPALCHAQSDGKCHRRCRGQRCRRRRIPSRTILWICASSRSWTSKACFKATGSK